MKLDFQMEEKILCRVVLLIFLSTVVAGQINVKLGEDCELRCDVPLGSVILWRWRHLEKYFLLYRDGRFERTHLKHRVELQDPELKSGNLGLILKRVTPDDSGKYECVALVQTPDGKREEFTHHIELTVTEDEPVYEALMDYEGTHNARMGQVSTIKEEKSDETEDQSRYVSVVAAVVSVSLVLVCLMVGILWKRKQIKEQIQKKLNPNQTSSSEPLKSDSQA